MTPEDEAKAYVHQIAEMASVLHGVIKLAVEANPNAAVSMVADYLEECGVPGDSPASAELIATWRARTNV
jgi:hypothetical protein